MARLLIVVVDALADPVLAPDPPLDPVLALFREAGCEVEVATLGGGAGVPVDAVDLLAYAAILLLGGRDALAAGPGSRPLRTAIETIARHGTVAALGTGAAGLLAATAPDGTPLVAGRRLASPGDPACEAALAAQGARIEAGAGEVVHDGNLLSGRNEPLPLARALLAAIGESGA